MRSISRRKTRRSVTPHTVLASARNRKRSSACVASLGGARASSAHRDHQKREGWAEGESSRLVAGIRQTDHLPENCGLTSSSKSETRKFPRKWRARQVSNLRPPLRRPVLSPLSYVPLRTLVVRASGVSIHGSNPPLLATLLGYQVRREWTIPSGALKSCLSPLETFSPTLIPTTRVPVRARRIGLVQ